MNNQSKLFRKVNEIILFDDNMIESAKECFQDYVEKGIILTTNFEENKWVTTNEYSNVSFVFNLNKFRYKRFYEQVFQLSFDDFLTYYGASCFDFTPNIFKRHKALDQRNKLGYRFQCGTY